MSFVGNVGGTPNTELIEEFSEGNAHLAWVMALYLDRNDIKELATNGITDGNNDKKIDFIDLSDNRIIIAQGYYCTTNNVHNVSESVNVKQEIDTVVKCAQQAFENDNIQVSGKELGIEMIEKLYINKNSLIVIKENIKIKADKYFHESGDCWNSVVFSATGKWLKDIYDRYGEDLFSANYRGFLGVKRKKCGFYNV
ncbi:hypothetical protein AN1V17_36000 [Vallitalea sediminicola]